jgi:hypothetical protein
MSQSVIILISDASDGFDIESWSSEGEVLVSPFTGMDDESLEDDLDYFVALDLSVAETPSRVAPGEPWGQKKIGMSKQSVGIIGESSQGIRVPRRHR